MAAEKASATVCRHMFASKLILSIQAIKDWPERLNFTMLVSGNKKQSKLLNL